MTMKRPDRTTMEGMIWNANHILDTALDPSTKGVPKSLFLDAKGIVLISIVEIGFMFSGNVGSGIIMVKGEDNDEWGNPSAVGLAGVGWGFLMGGAIKDVMIFLMDKDAVDTYSGTAQAKLGAEGNITMGPFGRDVELALTGSNQGIGGTVSVAFSRGGFIGFALEGAIIGPRNAVNAGFYGKELTPRQIFFSDDVQVPESSQLEDVHKKLFMLAEGKTAVPTEEEKEKSERLRVEADEKAKSMPKEDIEYVDAAKKAEEEEGK